MSVLPRLATLPEVVPRLAVRPFQAQRGLFEAGSLDGAVWQGLGGGQSRPAARLRGRAARSAADGALFRRDTHELRPKTQQKWHFASKRRPGTKSAFFAAFWLVTRAYLA